MNIRYSYNTPQVINSLRPVTVKLDGRETPLIGKFTELNIAKTTVPSDASVYYCQHAMNSTDSVPSNIWTDPPSVDFAGTIIVEAGFDPIYNGKSLTLCGLSIEEFRIDGVSKIPWECKEKEGEILVEGITFGGALVFAKSGYRISRRNWNGKDLVVVYQKGYPDGIKCNKQTAEAWGISEGDLFRCDPYLQINTTDGSHAMWVPSIRDVLADDWFVIGNATNEDRNRIIRDLLHDAHTFAGPGNIMVSEF